MWKRSISVCYYHGWKRGCSLEKCPGGYMCFMLGLHLFSAHRRFSKACPLSAMTLAPKNAPFAHFSGANIKALCSAWALWGLFSGRRGLRHCSDCCPSKITTWEARDLDLMATLLRYLRAITSHDPGLCALWTCNLQAFSCPPFPDPYEFGLEKCFSSFFMHRNSLEGF